MDEKKDKTGLPKTEKQVKPKEKIVYLGIPMVEKSGFSINYGTIFADGIPDGIAARAKDDKIFAKFLIPVSKAAWAMKELQNSGSDLSRAKKVLTDEYWKRKAGK